MDKQATPAGSVLLRRPRRWSTSLPRPARLVLLVLAAGIFLRVLVMVSAPGVVNDYFTGDSTRYARIGYGALFEDPWQPAGYPAFLALLRGITTSLSVTVLVQHALGVLTAGVLYCAARRAGAGSVAALLPAGVVLFSGDHLFLEHGLLSEAVWMPLLALALYFVVRASAEHRLVWLSLASASLAASALVRNLSLVLLGLLVVGAAVVAGRTGLRRAPAAAAAAVVPAGLLLGGYVALASIVGTYAGMGEMSGWSLYARVGQFADCRQFDPPGATQGLCEATPPSERAGPYHYLWAQDAPYRDVFPGMPWTASDAVGDWARAAIRSQPDVYLRTVATDVARYVDPQLASRRPAGGTGPELMQFRTQSIYQPETDVYVERLLTKYSGVRAEAGPGAGILATYHRVVRVNGLGLLVLLVLALAGAVRGRGTARVTCTFVFLGAGALLVLPAAVSAYEARYAIPPTMFLAVGAALGCSTFRSRAAADVAGPSTSTRHPGDPRTRPLAPARAQERTPRHSGADRARGRGRAAEGRSS